MSKHWWIEDYTPLEAALTVLAENRWEVHLLSFDNSFYVKWDDYKTHLSIDTIRELRFASAIASYLYTERMQKDVAFAELQRQIKEEIHLVKLEG